MNRVLELLLVSVTLALLAGMTGCDAAGQPQPVDKADAAEPPPDLGGFIQVGCLSADDCAPTACEVATCVLATRKCEYADKACESEGTCTKGVCEASTGECVQEPDNEGAACTATTDEPGLCTSGVCNQQPTCAPQGFFFNYLFCDVAEASIAQGNNALGFLGQPSVVVSAYGCAPTEAGPEVVYHLSHDPNAGDEDVTIVMRPVKPDGTPATSDDKDLDLIILEDVCTGFAACMNPAISAGGYQGVTAGTAHERVTFRARSGKEYYIVVDGKDVDQTADFVLEIEACGRCLPTETTRLSCNMTMPIDASTQGGAAQLTDYTCGSAMTSVTAAGKEIPFYLRTDGADARNITAKLTGATSDYTLFALPDTIYGQCDPTQCIDHATGVSGDATLTFPIDPAHEAGGIGNDFGRYWVVVDTPGSTDTSFGLELSCPAYCGTGYTLTCGAGTEKNRVNGGTTVGGLTQASEWGPAPGCDGLTGLTGPEKAIRFDPKSLTAADYELRLQGETVDKDLSVTILDAGTGANPACDPGHACHPNTVVSGIGFSGTRTSLSVALKAGIRFTTEPGHTYFIIVDTNDAAGARFDLQIVGQSAGAGCPS